MQRLIKSTCYFKGAPPGARLPGLPVMIDGSTSGASWISRMSHIAYVCTKNCLWQRPQACSRSDSGSL